jgi:hypothetical protein
MRSGYAALLASVIMTAGCARGGEDRADTAIRGSTSAAGGNTAEAGVAPESSAIQPSTSQPSVTGRPSPPTSRNRPSNPSPQSPATPPPPSDRRPPTSASDTARGIVAVVGAVPITQVVLRPSFGRPITLTGALAREIGVASGADVWVRGQRVDARTIEVESYAVRSVDGVTAITGTLAADGDRLVLVTDDGRRHPIARPPAPLREHVGARVWISGDLGSTINAYGVLRPRR